MVRRKEQTRKRQRGDRRRGDAGWDLIVRQKMIESIMTSTEFRVQAEVRGEQMQAANRRCSR